jgi:hypothetical protein
MMVQLILTIPGTDWAIPWAGLGSFLLGLGSALSGYAAITTAKRAAREVNDEDHSENNDSGGNRITNGGG